MELYHTARLVFCIGSENCGEYGKHFLGNSMWDVYSQQGAETNSQLEQQESTNGTTVAKGTLFWKKLVWHMWKEGMVSVDGH